MIQKPASSWTDLDRYLRLFLHRKWLVITVFLSVMIIVQAMTFLLPTTYESGSIIAIEGKRILNPLVRGLAVATSPKDKLAAVRQKMLSWNSVNGVLQSIGTGRVMSADARTSLFVKLRRASLSGEVNTEPTGSREDATLERAVAHIRRNTSVETRGEDLIAVSYRGPDPALNADIVNGLVANLIEESARAERNEARDAYRFIEGELKVYKAKLGTSEERLRLFKEKNIGHLPGTEDINLTGLVSAKAALKQTELEAGQLQHELRYIDEQLASLRETVVSEVTSEANPMIMVLRQRITDLEIALANLRINYTDEHPRVKETMQQITDLNKRLAEEEQSTVSSSTSSINPIYQELLQRRHATQVRFKTSLARIKLLGEQVAEYDDKVSKIPEQEQQLVSLMRDYAVNESIYNMLLQKLEEARLTHELSLLSENVEKLKIVDYARPDTVPVSPDGFKILLMALLLAAATTGGLFFAMDYLDQSFKDTDDAQQYLGIPLLAAVPIIKTSRNERKARRSMIIWSGVTVLLTAALMVLNVHIFVGSV